MSKYNVLSELPKNVRKSIESDLKAGGSSYLEIAVNTECTKDLIALVHMDMLKISPKARKICSCCGSPQ